MKLPYSLRLSYPFFDKIGVREKFMPWKRYLKIQCFLDLCTFAMST